MKDTVDKLLRSLKSQRWLFAGAAIAATLAGAPLSANAQNEDACDPAEWPTETIELVSHASAGGGTDVTMRMWLPKAQKLVDENVIIVYKLGGGARAAHEYFQKQGPGCHTVMAFTQTHLYTIARGRSPIEMEDIQGVARAMSDPSVIVVRGDSPIDSYKELVEKSQNQALTWGVTSIGSTAHIGIARWSEITNAQTRIVPFGGDGESVTALRTGAVDVVLANLSESLNQIKEGDLRALAVLAPERVEDLPNVPSTYEFGHDVTVATTRGYYVHADTPPAIVDEIEQWILAAMESERFQDYLRSIGLNPKTNIAGAEVWNKQMNEMYDVAFEALRKLGMTQE